MKGTDLFPPWYEDLRAAKINSYVAGMRYIGVTAYRASKPHFDDDMRGAVPDLKDRATFLLCLDILRQRLKATTICLPEGDAYGPWAVLHWGGEGTRHHIDDGAAGKDLAMLAHWLRKTAT